MIRSVATYMPIDTTNMKELVEIRREGFLQRSETVGRVLSVDMCLA